MPRPLRSRTRSSARRSRASTTSRTRRGYVNVGIDADTAQFAAASIADWWQQLGRARYPQATRLTITADCGGSNGNRPRLWKIELQEARRGDPSWRSRSATSPPEHSKWNKIEHRLFSFITMNWRGKPLRFPGDNHQPDRRDHDHHRARGLRPARRGHLPRQDQSHRRRVREQSTSTGTSFTPNGTTSSSPMPTEPLFQSQ